MSFSGQSSIQGKPVLVFRHIACEGPGYLGDVLHGKGIPYRLIRVDQGEEIPKATDSILDSISGLVFMGGPMSVNDPLPWIEEEMALIRAAARASMPVLGHCLGGQMISRALGGTVTRNRVREIGWFPVEVIEQEAGDRWVRDIPSRFEAFHWHGETFSIPPGAAPILRSGYCARQGFVMDNILALQCHVEMKSHMVREWARLYADELAHPTHTVQSASDMQTGLEERIPALQRVADGLYGAWLNV